MTPLGEGWSAVAYRVPDSEGDWAVRVPRDASYPEVTGGLEVEAGVLPWLEDCGFATPRDPRAIRGADGTLLAVTHRVVEGTVATPEAITGRARRARFANDIGSFLAGLHALDPDAARAAGAPDRELWSERYAPVIEECRDLLPERSYAWLTDAAARFERGGATSQAPRSFVHGDIAPQHLFVDDEGSLAGVIDFGDAMVADPAIDLAGVLWGYGWPLTERVIATYEAAGGVVDDDARRRMQFYVDVVPIYLVRFGYQYGPEEQRRGVRQIAARAAAASRRSQGGAALR
jgi:aminoglycoside phosphotransferase (APT) family kinase protein